MEAARTMKDVSHHEFVKAYAAHLKRSGKMELPEWTNLVMTGKLKELAAYDPGWYYIRAASMARKIYLRGGIVVGGFRRIYSVFEIAGINLNQLCMDEYEPLLNLKVHCKHGDLLPLETSWSTRNPGKRF
ncbi:small ribosomal subunit protein eS19x-like [Nicotiana tabacum]|uniref:Small ribosomal subunit protein eS19x-like n=1 Tax=Nicotiana tabacum TaxID=4097 RepID=A0AC58UPQ0_TOBAC